MKAKAQLFYEFYSRPAAAWTCSRDKLKEAITEANNYQLYHKGDIYSALGLTSILSLMLLS